MRQTPVGSPGHAVRIILLVVALVVVLLTMLPACGGTTLPVVITPNPSQQSAFEGWGTSLAWWAELIGSWPNAAQRSALEDLLFTPGKGLGLTIARFNIGAGGPGNSCAGGFGVDKDVPSLERNQSALTAPFTDAAQITVLKDIHSRIGASALFEAFANSAPAWMLVNACTQGIGKQDNLRQDQGTESEYASYLADIVQSFHDNPSLGNITFRTVEPFNEPDVGWASNPKGGNQEGMYVDVAQQQRVIQDLYAQLQSRNMLAYTGIGAPDENHIDDATSAWNAYSPTTQGDVAQINTHSYNYSSPAALATLFNAASASNKRLWMSEYTTDGSGYLGDKDCANYAQGSPTAMVGAMMLSCRIVNDMNTMRPAAWVYWQAVEDNCNGRQNGYGLIQTPFCASDPNYQQFTQTMQYYVMGQYSKFIRPGASIIGVNDPQNTLAAYDANTNQLVLVTTNNQSSSRSLTYDLSQFAGLSGATITAYRTSGAQEALTQLPSTLRIAPGATTFAYAAPGDSITTFVVSHVTPGSSGATASAAGNVTLSVVKDTGSQANPAATWDINYAQISEMNNTALQTAINTGLKNTAELQKTQFLEGLSTFPPPPSGSPPSAITLDMAGSYLTPQLLSVGYSGYQMYAGAAHGVNLDVSVNLDLSDGKNLTNRDLVNPGAAGSGDQARNLAALQAAVLSLVQAKLAPAGAVCTIDQSKLIGRPDDPSPLFFTQAGAMIGYPNYTFGANPCGFAPALIPYAKLAGILNPVYFSGV